MELEHTVKVFPIDANLQDSVNALVSEGWELPPGIQAVAVYHLVRVKPQDAPRQTGALGRLRIDDSKVMIVPGTKN